MILILVFLKMAKPIKLTLWVLNSLGKLFFEKIWQSKVLEFTLQRPKVNEICDERVFCEKNCDRQKAAFLEKFIEIWKISGHINIFFIYCLTFDMIISICKFFSEVKNLYLKRWILIESKRFLSRVDFLSYKSLEYEQIWSNSNKFE